MTATTAQDDSRRRHVRLMRLRRRQMIEAFAVGGGAGLLSFLVGCASPPAPASPTRPAPAATKAPEPAATVVSQTIKKPAPSPTSQVGVQPVAGALHLNLTAEPDTIDPGRVSFTNAIEVVMRVFSNVYTFDEHAHVALDQADAMPQVSKDGKTITVKLKKNLTWSDGKPLTAKDFVYGAKRQLNPALLGNYAFTLYALEGAQQYNEVSLKSTKPADLKKLQDAIGISAPDPQTIVYKLVNPAPWFLSVLCTWNGLPVREDLVTQDGASEDNEDWTKDPSRYIGNGPYILDKHDAGVQFLFKSNPKYARGEPPIKTVQYYMIKDNTVAFAAYQAGELDILGAPAGGYVGPLIKPAIDASPTLTKEFQMVPRASTWYFGFNNTLPPFDKTPVRQAFSAAIDRKTFAEKIFKGLGLPAHQFVPPGFPGHYGDLPPQEFDPAKAKKLLADAGYKDGKGLPPVKFTFATSDTNKLVSQAAQAMFQQYLGVNVQLDPVEVKAFIALTKQQKTTPQMYLLGWNQDYPDPQDWYSTVFQSNSTVSHTGWKYARFDQLTREADVETDPAKRDLMYRNAAAILNRETPVAFYLYPAAAILVKPTVQGYTLDPFEYFVGQHSLFTMKLTS